jgi:hypothetical protein
VKATAKNVQIGKDIAIIRIVSRLLKNANTAVHIVHGDPGIA